MSLGSGSPDETRRRTYRVFIGKHPNSIRFRAEFTKEAYQMIISPNINVDLWVKLIQREGEVNLSLMGIGISVYMPILQ